MGGTEASQISNRTDGDIWVRMPITHGDSISRAVSPSRYPDTENETKEQKKPEWRSPSKGSDGKSWGARRRGEADIY